ncbi:hypothetical protein TNCV_2486801 [Trichonephila clavipes]|uniref:Uncharacterized protein n=1 Tax=Trichonephila clavipes TaxID=2585209 RepID=A0A8X7BB38_TRICX|nr:hypothetical protein TNCV_2486801 [Trichonephila clavipes]
MTEKSEECSSNQPVAQPGLPRDTVVSFTVLITEQHQRITQHLYVPNCIQGGWYTHQGSPNITNLARRAARWRALSKGVDSSRNSYEEVSVVQSVDKLCDWHHHSPGW